MIKTATVVGKVSDLQQFGDAGSWSARLTEQRWYTKDGVLMESKPWAHLIRGTRWGYDLVSLAGPEDLVLAVGEIRNLTSKNGNPYECLQVQTAYIVHRPLVVADASEDWLSGLGDDAPVGGQ